MQRCCCPPSFLPSFIPDFRTTWFSRPLAPSSPQAHPCKYHTSLSVIPHPNPNSNPTLTHLGDLFDIPDRLQSTLNLSQSSHPLLLLDLSRSSGYRDGGTNGAGEHGGENVRGVYERRKGKGKREGVGGEGRKRSRNEVMMVVA